MYSKMALAVLAVSMTACASYRPVVDTKGVDQIAFEQDMAECQKLAEEVNPAKNAIGGALLGAVLGAAIGSIGGNGHITSMVASQGAVAGAAVGGGAAAGSQVQVVSKCMSGRGYKVLN